MTGVIEHAPAKVNLWLRVLSREESGFHALETLFCAVSLADRIAVEPAEHGISLTVQGGGEIGPPAENLVVRAARLFYEIVGLEPAVGIELAKRIPAAAGLGGGSSDAAATLRALARLHGAEDRPPDLLASAAELGSDVPFFLSGSPLALGWGRGERLLALPPLPPRPVLLAHPGTPISTPAAFQRLAARRRSGADYAPRATAIAIERLGDWDRVAELATNDFEPVAIEMEPRIGEALEELRGAGAFIALLAGSGSSVFGVFRSAEERDAAADSLGSAGFDTWRVETLGALPAPPTSG